MNQPQSLYQPDDNHVSHSGCVNHQVSGLQLEVWLLITKDASSPRLCTKTLLRCPLITKKLYKWKNNRFSLVWVDKEIDC